MNNLTFFRLERVSVVDVSGADAINIVHNLTTNAIKSLELDCGCETFITDVRGKTIGHVFLFRQADRLRMIGAVGQSAGIAAHVDRYTIREDAVASVLDDRFAAIVISPSAAASLPDLGPLPPEGSPPKSESMGEIRSWRARAASADVQVHTTRWLGEGTCLMLVERNELETIGQWLTENGWNSADEPAFHRLRTIVGFPWHGIDLDDKNLPQEADRDAWAVSFTKGCYLGQETVARLDALGQVQKKLVRWSISGGEPPVGTTLEADGKTVGRLTSVAMADAGKVIAIGYARRSHFDPGSVAAGTGERGQQWAGTVLA